MNLTMDNPFVGTDIKFCKSVINPFYRPTDRPNICGMRTGKSKNNYERLFR